MVIPLVQSGFVYLATWGQLIADQAGGQSFWPGGDKIYRQHGVIAAGGNSRDDARSEDGMLNFHAYLEPDRGAGRRSR